MSIDQATLQEIKDKADLIELVKLERFWRDQAEWENLASCYTPDGVVRTMWFRGPVLDFIEASKKMRGGGRRSKHLLSPIYAKVSGDRALVESDGQIFNRSTFQDIYMEKGLFCRFVSRARRIGGLWKLETFDCIYERDSATPLIPGEKLPFDQKKLAQLRPCYPHWAYVLGSMGHDLSQEMLGEDRPDDVKAFYRREEAWLNGQQ